jgi:hypothetical protein
MVHRATARLCARLGVTLQDIALSRLRPFESFQGIEGITVRIARAL